MNKSTKDLQKKDSSNPFDRTGSSILRKELSKKMTDESKEIINEFKIVCKTKINELKKRAEEHNLIIDDEDEKELFDLCQLAKEARTYMLDQILSDEERAEEIIIRAQDIIHSRFDKKNKKSASSMSVDDLLIDVENGNLILEDENVYNSDTVLELEQISNEEKKEKLPDSKNKDDKSVVKGKSKTLRYFTKVNKKFDSFLEGIID